MWRQSYEFVEVSNGRYQLPFTLEQSNPKLSRLPGLFFLTALAGLIVLPQLALAVFAIASAPIRNALIEHPVAALQLAIAFAFWAGLVCWPLRNILMSLICDRHVDIRDGAVRVSDRSPFGASNWQRPIASYEGVALNTRSSLSGTRHEAVLIHPDSRCSIVLMVADRIGEGELRELAKALALPIVAAGRLYGAGGPPDSHTAPKNPKNLVSAHL